MRRIIVVFVILLLMVGNIMAAPVTISDPNGQSEANVTHSALSTTDKTHNILTVIGNLTPISSCYVKSVNIWSANAGDMITAWNMNITQVESGLFNNATLEFEIGISDANSSNSYDAKGARFDKGLFINATNTSSLVTVSFDYQRW